MIMPTDNLINALIKTETNGNDDAIGDNGKAFGCLQIWQVVIDDVNRIYHTEYEHNDCFIRERAVDICKKYLLYWGMYFQKKTGEEPNEEILAKIWNGGPNGWLKEKTNEYWERVKVNLNE